MIPGVILFVLVMTLTLVSRASDNEALGEAAAAICGLSHIVVGIWLLIVAFGDSVGQGFLTLCVPCYAFYYVIAKVQNVTLQGLFAGTWIANILMGVVHPALFER